MTKKTGSGLAVLALLGWCSAVQALGLGAIEVKSGFNQPLLAEVPIIAEQQGEVESLTVSLASSEAFARVGLDRPSGVTANLRFAVTRTERGDPVIRVTTSSPVRDPYVIFLIDVQWSGGRLVREYSVLIDPPHMAPAIITSVAPTVARSTPPAGSAGAPQGEAPSQASSPQLPAENLIAPLEEPVPAVVEPLDPVPAEQAAAAPESTDQVPLLPEPLAEPLAEPMAEQVAESTPEPATEGPTEVPVAPAQPIAVMPAPAPLRTGSSAAGRILDPVADGQTLREIALQARDADVSVNQMMIALLNANRQAFINDNINLLKRGAILRVPDREEVLALPSADATALVAVQNELWRQNRAGSAPVVRAEPVSGADQSVASSPEAAAATPNATGETGSAGRTGADSPRLEIVAADAEAETIAAQSGLDETGGGQTLSRAADDSETGLISDDARLEAMQQRLARLEKIRADSERLLALRDEELAALQARMTELEQAVVEQPWYNRPWTFAGAIVLVSGLIALILILRRDRTGLRYTLEPQPKGTASPFGGADSAAKSTPESSARVDRDPIPPFAAHVPATTPQPSTVASVASGRAVFEVKGPVLPADAKLSEAGAPDAEQQARRPAAETGDERWVAASVTSAHLPEQARAASADDAPGLSEDTDADESESVDSRLDLAQALIYMGDTAGARTLLEEVANGREPELARLAREKLDELG